MEWVLYPALLVVINDTMAYGFGVLLGKHKLLPRLSPKKTVEGFIGAAISTCAAAVPLLKLFVNHFGENSKASFVIGDAKKNLVKHALIIGLYTSFISPFGGFLASAVKRAHDAKDFGNLIPGHGGVVDRFDCQVVTAPFVYLYLKACLGGITPGATQIADTFSEVLTEGI
jgi:phosphatidate cytidylyltransferase/cell division cycle 2-like protein